MEVRDLYGGAVRMAMPAGYIDLSDLRQVPDHQEAWAAPDQDTSIIVEILQREESLLDPSGDDEAAGARRIGEYFFHDLADANGASDPAHRALNRTAVVTEDEMPRLPPGAVAVRAAGWQHVAKHAQGLATADHPRQQVLIFMTIVRLPEQETDILITMSAGQGDADVSPARVEEAAQAGGADADADAGTDAGAAGADVGGGTGEQACSAGVGEQASSAGVGLAKLYDQALRPFEIADMGLFG